MRNARTNRREYRFYQIVRAAAHVAPFWLLQKFGALLGVLFVLVSSRRRTVLANLRRVFPDRPFRSHLAIALGCAAHFGRITFDFLKWSHAPAGTLERMVRCAGLDNLKQALAAGKGCFILSAHFGHWEVAAQWLAMHGFPQALVHRPLDNPLMERELAAARTRFGSSLIPKAGAMRGIVKTLRTGGIVDILLDQKVDLEHGVVVDFLGIPTPTTPSLARVALAAGVPVVPLFSYPNGVGYEFAMEPAILPSAGDTVVRLTQRYNDVVSRRILDRPELWFWFHDRWRPRFRRAPATELFAGPPPGR